MTDENYAVLVAAGRHYDGVCDDLTYRMDGRRLVEMPVPRLRLTARLSKARCCKDNI